MGTVLVFSLFLQTNDRRTTTIMYYWQMNYIHISMYLIVFNENNEPNWGNNLLLNIFSKGIITYFSKEVVYIRYLMYFLLPRCIKVVRG